MGLSDGFMRIVNAMEEGLEKRGFAGMVGYGASAVGGEVVVQPISAVISSTCEPGKAEAFDQKYQKMYDDTMKGVQAYDDNAVGALISLGCDAASNCAKLPKAAYDSVQGK